MSNAVSRPVLLYDAGCRLCRGAARLAARLDRSGELALLGLQDAEADQLLGSLRKGERLESVRLALPDGRLLSGGTATLETLAHLPSTRPLVLAARSLHAYGAIERLYDVVAGNRDRLGRLVPDGPAPRRFP